MQFGVTMVLLELRPESVAVEFEPLDVGASITALTVALFSVLVGEALVCRHRNTCW